MRNAVTTATTGTATTGLLTASPSSDSTTTANSVTQVSRRQRHRDSYDSGKRQHLSLSLLISHLLSLSQSSSLLLISHSVKKKFRIPNRLTNTIKWKLDRDSLSLLLTHCPFPFLFPSFFFSIPTLSQPTHSLSLSPNSSPTCVSEWVCKCV